jgi:hypothetical protein
MRYLGRDAAPFLPDLIAAVDAAAGADECDEELESRASDAALVLAAIGPDAKRAVPSLRVALRAGALFHDGAELALAAIGPAAVAAVPELSDGLWSPFLPRSASASAALAAVDPGGGVVLPHLRALAAGTKLRGAIATTIGRLRAASEGTLLASWIDEGTGELEACAALAEIGPAARAVLPAVERLFEKVGLEDERPVLALMSLAPERIPELGVAVLDHRPTPQDSPMLFHARRPPCASWATIRNLGERARPLLPAILARLDDPEWSLRALRLAANIDRDGDSWLPTAIAWIEGEDPERADWALRLVSGSRRTRALRDLLVTHLATNPDVVARALAEFDTLPAELTPELVAIGALPALARVPPIARAHLDALLRLVARDPDHGLPVLANLDDEGRAALRTLVDACADPDAPPTPAAIDAALARLGLTRAQARARLGDGLPDARCARALSWLG